MTTAQEQYNAIVQDAYVQVKKSITLIGKLKGIVCEDKLTDLLIHELDEYTIYLNDYISNNY